MNLPAPLPHALELLEAFDDRGRAWSPGHAISFERAKVGTTGQMTRERVEGRIRQLFVDQHPSLPEGRLYADVYVPALGFARCWFWRDHPENAGYMDPPADDQLF